MKLKINNRTLDFEFGLGFLGELIEETGKSIEDVLIGVNENPFKYIPVAMYVSARYGLEKRGKTADFNRYDFIEWVEADGGLSDKNESAIKFIQELYKSLTKDVPKEEEKDSGKGAKKK